MVVTRAGCYNLKYVQCIQCDLRVNTKNRKRRKAVILRDNPNRNELQADKDDEEKTEYYVQLEGMYDNLRNMI